MYVRLQCPAVLTSERFALLLHSIALVAQNILELCKFMRLNCGFTQILCQHGSTAANAFPSYHNPPPGQTRPAQVPLIYCKCDVVTRFRISVMDYIGAAGLNTPTSLMLRCRYRPGTRPNSTDNWGATGRWHLSDLLKQRFELNEPYCSARTIRSTTTDASILL